MNVLVNNNAHGFLNCDNFVHVAPNVQKMTSAVFNIRIIGTRIRPSDVLVETQKFTYGLRIITAQHEVTAAVCFEVTFR